MGAQPRNMELEQGRIEFSDVEPVVCNDCGEKVRKEIVEVRNTSDMSGIRCIFDTAIMCECKLIDMELSDYTTGGLAPDAWVDDEKWKR